jgi:hypothetical protein
MSKLSGLLGNMAATLLPFALFSFGIYATAFIFFRSPTPIKQAVQESGFYQSTVDNAVVQATKTPLMVGDINVSQDVAFQQMIAQSVSSGAVQKQVESTIDTVYAWIHGERERLFFSFEFTDVQTRTADNAAAYIDQRIGTLPVCKGGQMPNTSNLFASTCLPPYVDAAALRTQVRNNILNDKTFADAASVSQDTFTNEQGKTLEQQLSGLPAVYTHITWGTIIAGSLGALLIAAVLFLSRSYAHGLKRFGISAVSVGALSAGLGWLAGQGLWRVGEAAALSSNHTPQLNTAVVKIVQLVTQDVRNWWVGYGLGLMMVGVVTLVMGWLVNRRQASRDVKAANTTQTTIQNKPAQQYKDYTPPPKVLN